MDYPESSARPYLIADLPSTERPRERLHQLGADALTLVELLGIILRTGRKGRSVLDVAQDLLTHFHHDLGALAAATPAELARVKGIGPAKAAELKATFALAARLAAHVQPARPRLNSPAQVGAYLRETFRGKAQEELHVLLLDNKNGLLRDETVTVGLLDRSQSHPREVFRPAIQYAAAKVILAHNHPSGDPTPSAQDHECTRMLVDAGKLIGIEVVDHLVIGTAREGHHAGCYHSFKEHGEL